MSLPTPAAPIKADPARPWKAIAGGVVMFIGLIWANLDGRTDFGLITRDEWIGAVLGALIAFGAVYGIPNPLVPKTTGRHIRGDHGQASHALLIALAAIAIIGLALLLTGVLDVRGR